MTKPAPAHDELQIVISRIKAGLFMTTVGGLLVLTLASTLGEDAMRTIVLSILTIVFVIGGGLMGLVMMHHVGQTHLPEDAEEGETATPYAGSEVEALKSRRARGFLGLFSQQYREDLAGISTQPNTSDDLRRTA